MQLDQRRVTLGTRGAEPLDPQPGLLLGTGGYH
jgi:hypothetical protein